MIVACEQCSTRFQLDESRIPARGAQVRCSRCKHAFFVAPPGADADQVVQDVVAEATGPGASSAPAVTTDLDRTLFDTGGGANNERDDDEWEFNEDPPAGSGSRSARAPAAPAPAPELDLPKAPPPAAAEPDPKPASDSPLDELGNPEDWDFGGGDGQAPASASAAEATEGPPAADAVADEPKAATTAPPAAQPRSRKAQPRSRSANRMSTLLLEAVGYLAVALLLGTGVGRVVERATRSVPRTSALAAASFPVTGHGATQVRVKFLENAVAGNVVVVSGRRTSLQPGTGIQVEWMAHGAPIAGTATLAGPPVPVAWLREADPSELRTLLAQAAVRPEALPGGPPAGGSFVAVYEAVPQGATELRLTPVALPTSSPPQAAGAGQVETGAAPEGQAPAGAPSSSSPPSPLPSSG